MNIDFLFKSVGSVLNLKTHTIKALERLGIKVIRDLLLYKPSGYLSKILHPNLNALKPGSRIIAEVVIYDIVMPNKRGSPIKIHARNSTGSITLVFFNKISPSIWASFKVGSKKIIDGKVDWNDHHYQIIHPEFIWDSKRIVPIQPIYPLTYGVSSKQIHDYIMRSYDLFMMHYIHTMHNTEFDIVLDSIKFIHQPSDMSLLEKHHSILSYYELLSNQLSLAYIRKQNTSSRGRAFTKAEALQHIVLDQLGFVLSDGQQTVINEIENIQFCASSMNHMLQGDVGSGKTLVALMTMLNVVNQGVQSVLMAPTELLATQHFNFFMKALSSTNIRVGLLTGKTKTKEKKQILEALAKGEILILIGTHALFQVNVTFADLGYIVIDEQHKFGVVQRQELLSKAQHPDLLLMTATPIPRSLTMTLFGDMSVSRLTTKPTDRPEIVTILKHTSKMQDVIDALMRKLSKNEKIYWVCPLIESDEDKELCMSNVTARYEELRNIFSEKVGLIHGKMPSDLKDDIMHKFKNGSIDILVATTVIEVGIDVPNATLIVIENAERFGLAQLHQLRGRVGRSNLASHCILLYEYLAGLVKTRLEVMRNSSDGFYIAEQDLILRGGGEILGVKQSGEIEFRFANIISDMKRLSDCNAQAQKLNLQEYEWLIRLFYNTYTDNIISTDHLVS